MRIEILGAESLGACSLCCVVKTEDHKVVIDLGVAPGSRWHGLLPHPTQLAASERARRLIENTLENATDVVISHYHGDHQKRGRSGWTMSPPLRGISSSALLTLWDAPGICLRLTEPSGTGAPR